MRNHGRFKRNFKLTDSAAENKPLQLVGVRVRRCGKSAPVLKEILEAW